MVIITSGVVDHCLNCFLAMEIRADHFFVTLSCGTVHVRCQHCHVWNIMLDIFRDQKGEKEEISTDTS